MGCLDWDLITTKTCVGLEGLAGHSKEEVVSLRYWKDVGFQWESGLDDPRRALRPSDSKRQRGGRSPRVASIIL